MRVMEILIVAGLIKGSEELEIGGRAEAIITTAF